MEAIHKGSYKSGQKIRAFSQFFDLRTVTSASSRKRIIVINMLLYIKYVNNSEYPSGIWHLLTMNRSKIKLELLNLFQVRMQGQSSRHLSDENLCYYLLYCSNSQWILSLSLLMECSVFWQGVFTIIEGCTAPVI